MDVLKYLYGEAYANQIRKMDNLNLEIQNAMNFKYCLMFKKELENTLQELERKEHERKEINFNKS